MSAEPTNLSTALAECRRRGGHYEYLLRLRENPLAPDFLPAALASRLASEIDAARWNWCEAARAVSRFERWPA
jgi:hypothetical protein